MADNISGNLQQFGQMTAAPQYTPTGYIQTAQQALERTQAAKAVNQAGQASAPLLQNWQQGSAIPTGMQVQNVNGMNYLAPSGTTQQAAQDYTNNLLKTPNLGVPRGYQASGRGMAVDSNGREVPLSQVQLQQAVTQANTPNPGASANPSTAWTPPNPGVGGLAPGQARPAPNFAGFTSANASNFNFYPGQS